MLFRAVLLLLLSQSLVLPYSFLPLFLWSWWFLFRYPKKSFPCVTSYVRLQGNSTVCHSSSMTCVSLLWVMLQLLLLPASIEFTLNSHAEDIIFGNYSFCHNLSVLASDHLGNKRLEMRKLDFPRKQPHQCLQCLYITAI